MAYVIAVMSKEEMEQVQELGFTLEEAPRELLPKDFDSPNQFMKMVWIDCSMLDLLRQAA